MLRTIWRDPQRYEEQYWKRIPGNYLTGDAARRDSDGYFWVLIPGAVLLRGSQARRHAFRA